MKQKTFIAGIVSLFILCVFVPIAAHATQADVSATYTPLVVINGLTDQNTLSSPSSVGTYIAGLYKWTISLSIALAVVVFTFNAFRYLLSESTITSKKAARDGMLNVVIGLVLILGAYLILKTINPSLVNLSLSSYLPAPPTMSAIIGAQNSGIGPSNLQNSCPGDGVNNNVTAPGIYYETKCQNGPGYKFVPYTDSTALPGCMDKKLNDASVLACVLLTNEYTIEQKVGLTSTDPSSPGQVIIDLIYPANQPGGGWSDLAGCQGQINNYGVNDSNYCSTPRIVHGSTATCTINKICIAPGTHTNFTNIESSAIGVYQIPLQ